MTVPEILPGRDVRTLHSIKGGPGKSICAPIDTFSVMFFLYREVFKIVTKGVAKSAYINPRDEGELTSAGTLHPRPSP